MLQTLFSRSATSKPAKSQFPPSQAGGYGRGQYIPAYQNVHYPSYQQGYSPQIAAQNSQPHWVSDHGQRPGRYYSSLGYPRPFDQPPQLLQQRWASESGFGESQRSAPAMQPPQSPTNHSR